MQFIKIWITVLIIFEILDYGKSQTQFPNKNESDFKQEIRIIENRQNPTQTKEHDFSHINSKFILNLYFGDIFADCMKNFVPFSDINTNCTRDVQHFVKEFNNQSKWAVQMFDSSAKYPGGILFGEVTELGNFDQCMSVSSKEFGINGAYALVNVQFQLANNNVVFDSADLVRAHRERSTRNILTTAPDSLFWAVCVPDSCTADDVRQSADHVLEPTFRTHNFAVNVSVSPLMYTSKSTKMKNSVGGLMLTSAILSLGLIMTVLGTWHELFSDTSNIKNNGFFKNCLKSYSVINNMKLLMADSENDELAIINGVKIIVMVGLVMGHRLLMDEIAPTISHEFFTHIYEDCSLSFLKNPLILETFFVISGFLRCVTLDCQLRNGKPFKFLNLLASKLVRILPTYIAVLLWFSYILPYTGDGPLWKQFYPEVEFCQKNWWTNFLFLHNYVNTYEMCMVHSWYLSSDMHFFIVGTLLVYIIYRWKKVGLSIFTVLFLLSVYLPAKYIYDHKQWGVLPLFRSNVKNLRNNEHFHSVYIKSHFRITTYLIGIAAAYIYLHIKKSKIIFSVISRVVGFSISTIVNLICYAATTGYLYLPSVTYNPWDHILYFTLQRITYALGVSYIIVVGSTSSFGIVSSILKSKFCVVVSRLSYIIYLVHFNNQVHSMYQLRQPLYENTWIFVWKFIVDTLTAAVYAIPVYLIFEAPSRHIFNHILNNVPKKNNNVNSNGIEKKLK